MHKNREIFNRVKTHSSHMEWRLKNRWNQHPNAKHFLGIPGPAIQFNQASRDASVVKAFLE